MDGLSKIKCHMFNAIAFEHSRTRLRVPAELGELEVLPWQRSELEQDPRVFVDGHDEPRAAAPPPARKDGRKRTPPKTDKAPKPKRRSSRADS